MKNVNSHPCFSSECHPTTGRIHLPVSPSCNIQCRFCGRGLNTSVQMPGNASKVLNPEEAMDILERALLLCPDLKVAGVAGPGDPLATSHALDTLIEVRKRYPQLINCLSTNGLALESSMPRLIEAGVDTITVTVNAISPMILDFLCAGILWQGKFIKGIEATDKLIKAQEKGIRLAAKEGLTIKVNMVLATLINGDHVEEVARTVAGWGASLINIIPLMPAAAFASHPAPTAEQIWAANEKAEKYLKIMKHCRRCRADACGIPGVSDYAKDLYQGFEPVETFSHG